MPNPGIVNFYYSEELPNDSIAIAKIQAQPYNPANFISINVLPISYNKPIAIWKYGSSLFGPADYSVAALNQTVEISGETIYYVTNQFFEITNVLDTYNNPLFYYHTIPINVTQAVILDENDNIFATPSLISGNYFYHSVNNGLYSIRYVDSSGFVTEEMLESNLIIRNQVNVVTTSTYSLAGAILTVFNSGNYYLRFIDNQIYEVLIPYNSPSNTPWFPRIRYSLSLVPPEYGKQPFLPTTPYLLGGWISGQAISNNIIQFERDRIYNSTKLPDILIFDSNNNIKYALDGTPLGQASTKGYEYNWQRGLISNVDWYTGRVDVSVSLDPTDIIFGFYSYQELDILFTELDLNPFTNPNVRNAEIEFYIKYGLDPNHIIYYQVLDSNGDVVQTNDPNPSSLIDPNTSAEQMFSQIAVGASVSVDSITVTDVRTKGGGLAPAYINIPEAINFWDLGFWNGKPYPSAGVSIVYIPQTILQTISAREVQDKVNSILPLGMMGVIKYYNSEGNES